MADQGEVPLRLRFERLEERFSELAGAFRGQREYTEFAFDRLRSAMQAGFSSVDSRFNQLERKLVQFIDAQAKTNELAARRLQLLEGGAP